MILRAWVCAGALAALGIAALAVDMPTAQWVRDGKCPSFVGKLCSLSEVCGHGLGIALIVVAIAVLDPSHRRSIPRILIAALGSGLLADVFKLFLGRVRPLHADLHGTVVQTFLGCFPLSRNSSWSQSFPSSHAATAAGLAIALAYCYPRGRWLFGGLAVLACCERVIDEYHYVSDICWGAAIGFAFAPLCIFGGRLADAFDRLERGAEVREPTDQTVSPPSQWAA